MTQIKTCETCQHWERRDGIDKHVGRCREVSEYWDAIERDDDGCSRKLQPEYAKHLAFVQAANDYYAMLLTRPNFGCVQHKQK